MKPHPSISRTPSSVSPPGRVAYIVSRFPSVTETFIVREMTAVERHGVGIDLFSLFPASTGVVHDSGRHWVARARRCTLPGTVRGVLWWATRRPARLASSLLLAFAAHAGEPRAAGRALVACLVACDVARVVAQERTRHVHAHFASYPALAAWMAHRLAGVSFSVTPHAHDIFLGQRFLRRKIRDASFVVAISHYNRGFLRAFGADLETPAHLVRCGVEPARYERRRPGDRRLRVLCVASLEEYKGHRHLLPAFAEVRRRRPEAMLQLIGTGSLRAELGELATQLGIADAVEFAGARSEAEVMRALVQADLFVLPSVIAVNGRMEGLPVALMEALAAEVPTVSTDLSGIPELVRPGMTGLLARPGDSDELARRILETIEDPSRAAERSRRGRQLVEDEYDAGIGGARLARLFSLQL